MIPKAIIFDMDGVLVDTHLLHDIALKAAVEKHEYEWVQPSIGCTKTSLEKLREMGITHSEDSMKIYAQKKRIYIEMLHEYVKPRQELAAMIAECKDYGIVVGICSNSSTKAVMSGLNLAGLSGLFSDYFIVANDVIPDIKGKPEPDLYRFACNRLEVRPEDVLVFEDSTDGFVAATRAYCNVELVSYNSLPDKIESLLELVRQTKRKVA